MWDAESGKQLHSLDLKTAVHGVRITPDRKRMLLGCGDGSLRLLDIETRLNVLDQTRFQQQRVHRIPPAHAPEQELRRVAQ